MKLRQRMAQAARARLARLEAVAARLEARGAVADLRPVLEEIGALETGLSLLSDYVPPSPPRPSFPRPVHPCG